MTNSIQILDVATENQITHYEMQNRLGDVWINSLVWSPNGKYFASISGEIWDVASGRKVSTLKGLSSGMATQFFTRMLAWSPDSKYLASSDDTQAFFPSGAGFIDPTPKVDTVVHIWNTLTGEEIFAYDGHTAGVNYLAWSSDGTKIASASADMTVKVWQAI
jgi:WD40 repeat protein